MELTAQEWSQLLSRDCSSSKERLILSSKLRKPYKLCISKSVWQKRFSDFGGMEFRQGRQIELLPKGDGGNFVELPIWVVEQLQLSPGDTVCITEMDRRFYLKKFDMVERASQIPGWLVIDEFENTIVRRKFSRLTDLDAITFPSVKRLLSHVGTLRHDPITPLMRLGGRIGILARRMFLDGYFSEDEDAVNTYEKGIISFQEPNGSWEDNTVRTAFNLIRLIEVGATLKDQAVAKATDYLLSTTEPIGLPGLFMFSEELASKFNTWKEEHASGKIGGSWTKTEEKRAFLDNMDILPNVCEACCETKMTFPSAIVIQALLRCGLQDHTRVIRAINTLLSLRSGRWCGCGYLQAHVDIPDSTAPVDFDNDFPIPEDNDGIYMLDWFLREKDLPKFVHTRAWFSGFGGIDYRALDIGNRKALLVKHFRTMGSCTLIVHRSLSYHSLYHGSNLEAIAALECSYRQSGYGTWGDAYLAPMFDFLERIRHPLAAFLVLRSIPLLIRSQKADGLWETQGKHEYRLPGYSLSKESVTYMIVKALKAFGFLEALLPQ